MHSLTSTLDGSLADLLTTQPSFSLPALLSAPDSPATQPTVAYTTSLLATESAMVTLVFVFLLKNTSQPFIH